MDNRGTAASAFYVIYVQRAETDWETELPKETWQRIIKCFITSPVQRDNGIASASRHMNIRWRQMHRETFLERFRSMIHVMRECPVQIRGVAAFDDDVLDAEDLFQSLDRAYRDAVNLLDQIE